MLLNRDSNPHRRTVGALLLAVACVLTSGGVVPRAAPQQPATGILLLAHGGNEMWNDNVRALAARINKDQPVEVAFGMATRANIQRAVDALASRGVAHIVAVPLFVSSHSSVVTSTEYLLGQRKDAPPELATFARMSHGSHGGAAHTPGTNSAAPAIASHVHEHGAPSASTAVDGTRPIDSPLPIRMTGALDAHPIVADILADRARAVSTDASREAVILVAHGPVTDAENDKWLEKMRVLAAGVQKSARYTSVDYMTVRDDAPAPIKAAATAELRALVTKHRDAGSRVLIVPVLLSYGGIEQGIKKRLEGLDYAIAPKAIMPDHRLELWVKQQAGG